MRNKKIIPTCFLVLLFFFSCEKNPTEITENLPEVTTTNVSNITGNTAQCGGTIISDGGSAIIACGVCWSNGQTPKVSDDKTTDDTGAGSFMSNITGLTVSTTYYVRAYATNEVGTGYGSAISFTTLSFETGTVTDIDGNTYQTIKIGNQWWMAENLKVIHYRNGESIPNITDNTMWSSLTTGAYCNFNNDQNIATTYGRLYDWYTVNDSHNIAPEGWHVPSDAEWKQLEMYLGMSKTEADAWRSEAEYHFWRGTDEGSKLKEVGTTHWNSPNTGATNESGFSALPGGYRGSNGNYYYMGRRAFFWCSTQYSIISACGRCIAYDFPGVFRFYSYKNNGCSVRCVKD
jgi:uncharacterized protein (TIGR02145 family)